MNENAIAYTKKDLAEITGRLIGEMMYYLPTAETLKKGWTPLLTRYLSGRESEAVRKQLDMAESEGVIRQSLRDAVAKNNTELRAGMPNWELRVTRWEETPDLAGMWCGLPVFDNYVYRAIDQLVSQKEPPEKIVYIALNWLQVNAAIHGETPSWRTKKLEALTKATKEASEPKSHPTHGIDAFRYFFGGRRENGPKDKLGLTARTDARTFTTMEIDARIIETKERELALSPLLAAPYGQRENQKETPMKTKFDSKTFIASLLASATTTATVQGGNAGLTAIKQLTLKLLPIKWGFWARVTGKHKKVAEHPLTTLAVTVGVNALVHSMTEEGSKARAISQALQTAAVLEAVNGVGELKNVVHSLLEPSTAQNERGEQ